MATLPEFCDPDWPFESDEDEQELQAQRDEEDLFDEDF